MFNEILATVFQVLVVVLIPFLFYVVKYKTTSGFFSYIGLKATSSRAVVLSCFAMVAVLACTIGLVLLNRDIKEALTSQYAVAGKLKQMGLQPVSIILLLIITLFRTSLAEEIFMRGFVAKRLISRLGFQWGNLLQALLFGLLHLIMMFMLSRLSAFSLSYSFIVPAVAGYIICYINERVGKGSIIPGWIAHGAGNVVAYYLLAFVL
ncbi:CPBP family glutamic-type intramembrane protease [uncultured Chitinophaga sp.]|jgi:CAAX amino terminal protease family.|uniref:CPBP family glutamic-type intramembrane protease n=1 Tax=uncultured Chitinophaga sp. TaxID=339340 RepID=UPI00262EA71B|nr:CPBP family glutamic-type intramembrane protease [uncultured Chitinophaga sp.]